MTTTLVSAVKPRVEDSFAISFAPLSLEEIYAKSDDPANGAVVMMSGVVRNQTDGKPVIALRLSTLRTYGIADILSNCC